MTESITIDCVAGTDLDRFIHRHELGEPAASPNPMVCWRNPDRAHRAAVQPTTAGRNAT